MEQSAGTNATKPQLRLPNRRENRWSAADWPPAIRVTVTPNPIVVYFCAALWSVFTPPLTVADLLARGMIVERRRGCLSTPGGTLEQLGTDALPERMARTILSVSNVMTRLGAAHLAAPK